MANSTCSVNISQFKTLPMNLGGEAFLKKECSHDFLHSGHTAKPRGWGVGGILSKLSEGRKMTSALEASQSFSLDYYFVGLLGWVP